MDKADGKIKKKNGGIPIRDVEAEKHEPIRKCCATKGGGSRFRQAGEYKRLGSRDKRK